MLFTDVLKLMKQGEKVKLPSWGGYWYWDEKEQTVMMHTKNRNELDIRETEVVEYTLLNVRSDEWVIADGNNCPQLGGRATFSFGEAIKYLKREGWNGKGQHIELASDISYRMPDGWVTNAEHDAIGNKAIAFVE